MTITLPHEYRGKVRDLYDVGDDRLLLVASDRISVFDVVLPDAIPDKGRVLDRRSRRSGSTRSRTSSQPRDLGRPGRLPERRPGPMPTGRAMLVRRTARCRWSASSAATSSGAAGASTGSRARCGAGAAGRDAGSRAAARAALHADDEGRGGSRPADDRRRGDRRGRRGARYAGCGTPRSRLYDAGCRARGVVRHHPRRHQVRVRLAPDGELLLIDEVITPDSSRYWPAEEYAAGGSPPSFDKQYVRDYYLTLGWDRTPPAPPLPDDGDRGDPAALRRGLRTAHRPVLRGLVRRIVSNA